jgi:protein phosphatase
MAIECAGLTDVGRKREHNEDSLLLSPRHGLVVIADGMGGHEAGEVASNIAITSLERFFDSLDSDPESTWPHRTDPRNDEYANRLAVGLHMANQRIREAAEAEHRRGMGTTCVALLVTGARGHFAWAGDSRGYHWRAGTLRQVTTDHSLLNELLRAGHITPAEVPHFQHRNVITRALGTADRVDVDVASVDLEPGDVLLLCSDGLSGMIDDDAIAAQLGPDVSLDAACQRLIDAANAAGGNDNVTVALVRYTP